MTNGIPYIPDPSYVRLEYLITLADIEDLFGMLRNAASDKERLKLVEEAVQASDSWLDGRYLDIGVTSEDRAELASYFMSMNDPNPDEEF